MPAFSWVWGFSLGMEEKTPPRCHIPFDHQKEESVEVFLRSRTW